MMYGRVYRVEIFALLFLLLQLLVDRNISERYQLTFKLFELNVHSVDDDCLVGIKDSLVTNILDGVCKADVLFNPRLTIIVVWSLLDNILERHKFTDLVVPLPNKLVDKFAKLVFSALASISIFLTDFTLIKRHELWQYQLIERKTAA